MWFGLTWWRRRDLPRTPWFLRLGAAAGVLSVITMEAGWVVTEVGRQPWIVYDYMKVEDAATGNTGVWITFFAVIALYVGVGVTTDPGDAGHEPKVPARGWLRRDRHALRSVWPDRPVCAQVVR